MSAVAPAPKPASAPASVNDTAAGFHSFGVMVSGLVRILRTKSNSVLR